MAVRGHAVKAVNAEEEQEWQSHMESVGRKSRLEHIYFWLEGDHGEMLHRTVKCGEKVEKCCIPGRAGRRR